MDYAFHKVSHGHYLLFFKANQADAITAAFQKYSATLIPQVKDFDELLRRLQEMGYEIKQGKYISFRAAGQERFTRTKTLGAAYTEEAIKERIKGVYVAKTKTLREDKKIRLVVDLENSIKAQQSAGYERWAKIHNLKQAAKSMNFLTENKIEYYSDLESKIADIMTAHDAAAKAVKEVEQRMVSTIITQSGSSGMSSVSLPQELIDAINNVGFWDSIPLWAVTLIGGLLITVLSFTMILTVYGRMFSLWMYAAIAPIPLSTFAGEPTSSVGKNFIRSYAGVCLQGVVIALSCIIFSAISSSPPAVDTGASVVTAVWTYVGELAFNLLVLVGAIKGCDRIVKEIMGL